jgi:hypothetical protein
LLELSFVIHQGRVTGVKWFEFLGHKIQQKGLTQNLKSIMPFESCFLLSFREQSERTTQDNFDR